MQHKKSELITMASVDETLHQINETLKSDSSSPYAKYSCKTVSWDDVQRGSVGGSLSCWGSNITDTRLYAKDGRRLFTIRSDNWNENLGKVTTKDVTLVASDSDGGGGSTNLRPFTLREVLADPSRFGGYAGLDVESLNNVDLDKEVSVRFQTTFLPVEAVDKAKLEFATEAYNYNTMDDENPRNLIFLCTSQGVAVQQDGKGAKKLYHHHVDDDGIEAREKCGEIVVHRHWLEAEASAHKVGGSQVESQEEKDDAIKRGKATSSVIGVEGIGTRFNVLMTIQVPLMQKQTPKSGFGYGGDDVFGCIDLEMQPMFKMAPMTMSAPMMMSAPVFGMASAQNELEPAAISFGGSAELRRKKPTVFGSSSAARVSRGSRVDTWNGLTVKEPKRHSNEHITVTIVLYYTCSGGVPTEDDVRAAIDDLENLYESVEENGRLTDEKFDFMKSELTVKDVIDIQSKVLTQPPPAKPNVVEDCN